MKKRDVNENDLAGLFFIGLGITLFAVFSVIGGFSKITGMVTGGRGELGDATAVYTLMIIVFITFITTMVAIYTLERRND